jgi:hypothetical protein
MGFKLANEDTNDIEAIAERIPALVEFMEKL